MNARKVEKHPDVVGMNANDVWAHPNIIGEDKKASRMQSQCHWEASATDLFYKVDKFFRPLLKFQTDILLYWLHGKPVIG